MIAFLSGQVSYKTVKSLILKQADIGWEIFVIGKLLEKVKIGERLELFTNLAVKEDALELYGFKTIQELEIFKKLNEVTRVGPKSALAILNLASPEVIVTAILNEDSSVLSKVSGIGKKTAERIVLELKNRLSQGEASLGGKPRKITEDEELAQALRNLGYTPTEINKAIDSLPANTEGVEAKIKVALKNLTHNL